MDRHTIKIHKLSNGWLLEPYYINKKGITDTEHVTFYPSKEELKKALELIIDDMI